MTLKYTVSFFLLVILRVSTSGNAFGQVDYKKLEPAWCKPHPSFQTAFAISNYETADIPVSYNKSIRLTGWRSFFNHEAIGDPVPAEEIWTYYQRCFAPFADSLLFEGPTLYCSRLCRNGQRAYVCLQSVNDGRNYFLTLIETDRAAPLTAEALTKALNENGRFVVPASFITDTHDVEELIKACNGGNALVHIAFQSGNPAEANRSIQNAKACYDALSKAGLKVGKANYTQLPPDFPANAASGCGNGLVEDRILLYVK